MVGVGSFNVSIGGFYYLAGSVSGELSWIVLPHSSLSVYTILTIDFGVSSHNTEYSLACAYFS